MQIVELVKNTVKTVTPKRMTRATLMSFMMALMLACGGSGGGNSSPPPVFTPDPIPGPPPEPQRPTPVEGATFSKLHASGTFWMNEEEEIVALKGVNLGNWLLQEFWMMEQTLIDDQCTLEATLEDRFGFEERERLMDLYRDNWISERDWDTIASFGFNVIRVPFIWNLIEDENNPMTLRDDAWQYLDLAIEKAEERNMWVILDLHGAVGAQGEEQHSGCVGLNEYWDSEEYQERTAWLWQEIATRYGERDSIAGYGLLNEPWGTTPENLAIEIAELYEAVREIDEDTIIILPGHHSGIDAYGSPADANMSNVAFEMHFYPGIFGWGEAGYEVHRDWLRCGRSGEDGVCAWDARILGLDTPFLIGELQPWASLGPDLGAEITRASFDTYAQYGWATTAWSYKIISANGGQGSGTWGLVTNEAFNSGTLGQIVGANTWTCDGWDSAFNEACVNNTTELEVPDDGTYYLVVKSGASACCGGSNLDVTIDNISLVDVDTSTELVVNGGFGDSNGWTSWFVNALPDLEFNDLVTDDAPTGAEGAVLRMSGTAEVNGGIYQAISLEAGKTYNFSGVFKDVASDSTTAWAEIYLVSQLPTDGQDVVADASSPLAALDFATAELAEIESLFTAFGTVPYDIHEEVRDELTTDTPSEIFTLPEIPGNFTVQVIDSSTVLLNWSANSESDVTGYNVYRTNSAGTNYTLLAEGISETTFTDTNYDDSLTTFYTVTAVDPKDESFPSSDQSAGIVPLAVPGRIQAEAMAAFEGIQMETASESGQNIGHLEAGDWFEYEIEVSEAAEYTVQYRVASEVTSDGFSAYLDGDYETALDSVSLEAPTGGWQTYTTIESTMTLPAGQHTLRFIADGKEINMTWFEFIAPAP